MWAVIPLWQNGKGIALITLESTFLVIDVIAVGLRVWARRLKQQPLRLNDWLIFVALFIMLGRYVTETMMVVNGGLGAHVRDVLQYGGPEAIVLFGKLDLAVDLLWVAAVSIIKMSILDLYTKIFTQRRFVQVANVAFYFCCVTGVAFILTRLLICIPPDISWNPSLPGHCGNTTPMYLVIVSVDLATDVFVVAMPMPVLFHLQMKPAKKIALMVLFGIGFFICAVTAVRLQYITHVDTSDLTYAFGNFGIFAALEPWLGILNACAPVIPPVFTYVFKTSAFSSQHSKSRGAGGYDWSSTSNAASNKSKPGGGGGTWLPLKSMPGDGGAHHNTRATAPLSSFGADDYDDVTHAHHIAEQHAPYHALSHPEEHHHTSGGPVFHADGGGAGSNTEILITTDWGVHHSRSNH